VTAKGKEPGKSAGATDTAANLAAAAARNNEGMALSRENEYQEAYSKFAEASRLDPGSALYANKADFAQYELHHYLEALQWYERALSLDPKRAVAYLNSGDAYMVLQRGDEARQAILKYLRWRRTGS
jgi:tetratricopeptide (TPR) repeat protein